MTRLTRSIIAALVVMVTLILATGSASATTQLQFTLKSAPGATVIIPNPPLPLTHVTVDEDVVTDPGGAPAGHAFIDCLVLAPIPTPPNLVLACTATFTLNDGNIQGAAAFVTDLHNYPAPIVPGSGTGAYAGAQGYVQVEDLAPGQEIFHFNLTFP